MAPDEIDVKNITIGQWADYFDTGIWTLKEGRLIAPSDLTIAQLKDFLVASGGAVYLGKDGCFVWSERRPAAVPADLKEFLDA